MSNHDFQWQELHEAKQQYQNIAVPECLDDYIRSGLQRGQQARRNNRMRRLSLLAACFVLFSFVTAVRVSPAVANYVRQIPGLEHIVNLIHYDKGLKSAIYNDFYQPLNLTDEHDGILFCVDGIIADESSMVVFYTIENNLELSEDQYLDIGEFKFSDESGEPIKAAISYGSILPSHEKPADRVHHQMVYLHFNEDTVVPECLKMEAYFMLALHPDRQQEAQVGGDSETGESYREYRTRNYLPATWQVTLPIDKTKYADMKKTYPLNQALTVQGQTVYFHELTIYPTRIALEIEYDSQNTAQIFGFDDLRLVDQRGEEWTRGVNGVTASKPGVNREIIYFQSNYFTSPDQLYLVGRSIRMLPKDQLEVVLDLEEKQLLQSPPGMTLKDISKTNKGLYFVHLEVEAGSREENHLLSPLRFEFKDSAGSSYSMVSQGSSSTKFNGKVKLQSYLELPDHDYQNPLIFTIQDYPERVDQGFRFRVK